MLEKRLIAIGLAAACVSIGTAPVALAAPGGTKLQGSPLFAETVSAGAQDELVVVFKTTRALPGSPKKPQGSVSLDDYVRPVKVSGPAAKHCYAAKLTSDSAHTFKVGQRYSLTFIFGPGSAGHAETRSLKVLAPLSQFPECP